MKVKSISIKADLNNILNIEKGWFHILVTTDNDWTYIFTVITYKTFLVSDDENNVNFLPPRDRATESYF